MKEKEKEKMKEKKEEKQSVEGARVPIKEVYGDTALMQMKRVLQCRGCIVVRIDYGCFECYDKKGNLRLVVIDTTTIRK